MTRLFQIAFAAAVLVTIHGIVQHQVEKLRHDIELARYYAEP